jgi:hypothetical protein
MPIFVLLVMVAAVLVAVVTVASLVVRAPRVSLKGLALCLAGLILPPLILFVVLRMSDGMRGGMQISVLMVMVAAVLVWVVTVASIAAWALRALRRDAGRAGYASLGDYLRAAPQSDWERQRAVDLALKGLALCLAGLILPPLILIGVFPLYYGMRKVLYAQMGLGLVDDPDRPVA